GGGLGSPVGGVLILFWRAMPLAEVLGHPLGHWLAVMRPGATSLPFYRQGMGLDDVGASLKTLLSWTLGYVLVLGALLGLALAVRRHAKRRVLAAVGACVAILIVILAFGSRYIAWSQAARPLPLFVLVLLIASLAILFRRLRRGETDHALVLRVSLTIFALALLGKMLLNARIY